MKRANRNDKRGFTLAEVLLAVGILVVLFALAMIPITRMQKELRQTELDGKAEIVFAAAQNRMTQLQAAGMKSLYQLDMADVSALGYKPLDSEEDETIKADTLCFVTSESLDDTSSSAYAILPEDQLEAGVRGAYWIVEFNPASGSVYAVFYSEQPITLSPEDLDFYRIRSRRLDGGAVLGYYGGDAIDAVSTGELDPELTLINAERLQIKVVCDRQGAYPLEFYATITDGNRNKVSFQLGVDEVKLLTTRRYEATLTLDELTDGLRFAEQNRLSGLTPGSDLTVTIRVSSKDKLVDAKEVSCTTNSLFEEVRPQEDGGKTAVLTYARHLQNLDRDSGVMEEITAAVQEADIQFISTSEEGWDSLYGTKTFQPIRNDKLRSYSSSVEDEDGTVYHPVIYDLTVNTSGDAGLFASFSGDALNGVRLSGAKIKGMGNVGALAGAVTRSAVIDGCQVYLSRGVHDHLIGKTEQDLWLDGEITGGLVGTASGRMSVTNSFAATVLRGNQTAGGLIGRANSSLTVEHSYADCYLYAGDAGTAAGLVGTTASATSTLVLKNCYAAGFLSAGTTAGLTAIEMTDEDSLINCYTAAAPLEAEQTLTYSTACPSIAMPQLQNVFYLAGAEKNLTGTEQVSYTQWSGENRVNAARKLGGDFTAVTGDSTMAYNLKKGLGLTAYSYPKLTDLPHYGDWQAEFESGTLVYYERYTDGWGFYGGGKSALSDTSDVLGDGYGVVYEDKNAIPESGLTVMGEGINATSPAELKKDSAIEFTNEDKTYYLLPLPTALVDRTALPETGFYYSISIGTQTYAYNPHFAKTVTEGDVSTADAGEQTISIRTARQLYALSLYYDAYSTRLVKNATFSQERSIDYPSYSWRSYTVSGKTVAAQAPIGTGAKPFTHIYNGGSWPITGLSITAEGDYAGMFGRSRGQLRNIVLRGEEEQSIRINGIIELRTVHIGVLAGENDGSIYNCSVSGYFISNGSKTARILSADRGSTVYAGALTGYNIGSIRACSAVLPEISAMSYLSTVRVGGFAGYSSGHIRQSYAMGMLRVDQIKGGDVTIAGFVAENRGSLRRDYCGVAMSSAGADTYAFAPSGSTAECYYLGGGMYSYRGQINLYQYPTGAAATAVSDEDLMTLELSGFETVDAENTYDHPQSGSASDAYPYPGVVTGPDGKTVQHYGDWVVKADLGEIGVLYWEKEEGGANAGYRISYVGFEGQVEKQGSSLCQAHDDSGVVTAFGYGYYWRDGQSEPRLTSSNYCVTGTSKDDVCQSLRQYIPGYDFMVYETGAESGSLRLLSADQQNTTWQLYGRSGQENGKIYNFEICPFFGNALSYTGGYGTLVGSTAKPGETDREYEIRSVEQLQFINWSYTGYVGKTDRYVNAETYKTFPYLQYASIITRGTQTRENAVHTIRNWKQTHDLNGAGRGPVDKSTNAAGNKQLAPIAGAVIHTWESERYKSILYNWFGGSYDGQNYYIKNIDIDSPCYNVGLFGTTVGATIQNIILYSDNNAVIQRSSDPSSWDYQNGSSKSPPSNVREYQCAYALGGLVGIAYDYNNGSSTIENCAIAGYKIEDNSKNMLALGEAVVGGLVGVSNVDLKKCSAVVDIEVNCTHLWKADGSLASALYGNFVRVGGLVGGLRYKATDCYTGGKITVSEATLKERIKSGDNTNKSFVVNEDTKVKWPHNRGDWDAVNRRWNDNLNPATYVFIGGVGGSGFSSNFINFTDSDGQGPTDGSPVFENCYTYLELPEMQGTITGISVIGSLADRYADGGGQLTIKNCYYLGESTLKYLKFEKLSMCYNDGRESMYSILNGNTSLQQDMLNGDLLYLNRYMWSAAGWNKRTLDGLTKLTYTQMSQLIGESGIQTANAANGASKKFDNFVDALNNGRTGAAAAYDWVTSEEDGAQVHGKYSFPGADTELLAQDYPFPTVLRQTSALGETVNLHYGRWPKAGLYWSRGIASIDLLTNFNAEANASTITLELIQRGVSINTAETPKFEYTDQSIVAVSSVEPNPDADTGGYIITLTGLKTGAAEITATVGGYEARLMVTVGAEMSVTAEPDSVSVDIGGEASLRLSAKDAAGQELAGVKWSVESSDATIAATKFSTTDPSTVIIKGVSEGDVSLLVSADYTLPNGMTFHGETILSAGIMAKATD